MFCGRNERYCIRVVPIPLEYGVAVDLDGKGWGKCRVDRLMGGNLQET